MSLAGILEFFASESGRRRCVIPQPKKDRWAEFCKEHNLESKEEGDDYALTLPDNWTVKRCERDMRFSHYLNEEG
jgi:hypothetical protein